MSTEREARYAEAIESVLHGDRREQEAVGRAVVAVADAEQAELRAACIPITDLVQELNLARQNLRRTEGELAALREQMETMRAGAHEVGRISMAAVAREKALRGQIEALADEWDEHNEGSESWRVFGPQVVSVPHAVERLRALAASPAEPTP